MRGVPDLYALDATAQAELVRNGECSAGELVASSIERIEKLNGDVNAVIHRRFEKAVDEADKATGPFAGVPMLVKDALCQTAGDPFHCGMEFLKRHDWHSDHDSWLGARYKAAGFIVVGKTNLPELAASPTTEPAAYGPSRNPWALDHSPGGSSGGTGAGVAAGLASLGHGNDMGGSIRIPASMCGLVGLKPSRGRTTVGPDFGEYWGQMTHEHVLTRTVRDSAGVLDAVAGYGTGDPYTAPAPAQPWVDDVGANPGSLRVGVRLADLAGSPPHADCQTAVERTLTLLGELGHNVEDTSPGALDRDVLEDGALPVFFTHIASELARIGSLVGTEITADDVEPTTWQLAEMGRAITVLELIEATQFMQSWSRDLAAWWEDDGYDLLVTPTLAAPPPPLGAMAAEPDGQMPFLQYTPQFNVSGQPAISLPLHWNNVGLPIGVQLIAAYGREDLLFRVASQLEEASPWADRWPEWTRV